MPALKINNHIISYNNQFAKQIDVYNLTTAIGSGVGSMSARPTTGAKGFESYLWQSPADDYIFYDYTEEGPGYFSAGNYIFGAGDGTVYANFVPITDSYFVIHNYPYWDTYSIKNVSQDVVSATYITGYQPWPEIPFSEDELNMMKSNTAFTISSTRSVKFYMNNSSTTFTENIAFNSQWGGNVDVVSRKILTNNEYGVSKEQGISSVHMSGGTYTINLQS